MSDRDASARLRLSPAPDAVHNGVDCDGARRKSPKRSSETDGDKAKLWLNENGISDSEPPHGSVVGSNGFILAKPEQPPVLPQQQQQENSAGPKPASPHRTNCLPSGALRTGPSGKAASGQETTDTRTRPPSSSASSPPLAVTIHRARKTMSRPAVSPAQKVKREKSWGPHLCRISTVSAA